MLTVVRTCHVRERRANGQHPANTQKPNFFEISREITEDRETIF